MKFADLGKNASVVFCVGAGGSGKTTTAAAISVEAATAGRRVLLLLADPACEIELLLPQQKANYGKGSLHFNLVDTAEAFDALMRRIVFDESRLSTVFSNRVYQAFSGSLVRSHAYAVTEALYAAQHCGDHDLIIVDTPPASSLFELIDAPGYLSAFLNQRVLRFFIRNENEGGLSLRSRAAAQRLLKRLIGRSTVEALVEFLTEMSFLSDGFHERMSELHAMMKSTDVAFVVVGTSSEDGIEDLMYLLEDLGRREFSISSVLLRGGPIEKRIVAELQSATNSMDSPFLGLMADLATRQASFGSPDELSLRPLAEG